MTQTPSYPPALYKNFAPRDEECDRVVKEAQTKAIAKARGVGTDDISIHFWVVLTLENGTMLHIDAVGKLIKTMRLFTSMFYTTSRKVSKYVIFKSDSFQVPPMTVMSMKRRQVSP